MAAKGKARATNLPRYPRPIATRCSPSSIRYDAHAGNKSRGGLFRVGRDDALRECIGSAGGGRSCGDRTDGANRNDPPGYAALGEATSALSGKVDTLCKEPSDVALKEARNAFATTVDAWSKVEIFRFGPINEDHRFDRLFYWPDPKSIGLKQVQDALAHRDPQIEDEASFRCSFANSVATNVDRIAKNVIEGWCEGSAYEKAFLTPSAGDPAYHAPKEVTLELYKAFATGIELVRDQKLAKALGSSPSVARPKLAPFWRSGLSFPNMIGNLDGVRLLFAEGGFAQVVKLDSPGVENSILFDLDHAIDVLEGINQPFAEAVTDEDTRAKLDALRVGLKSASATAGDIIARSAGLSFGFNAMDGD